MRKKVLIVGDAGCPSGFARATHEIADRVQEHHDVTILAVNYRGDPPVDPKTGQFYPYPLYAASAGGDAMGFGRLLWMCNRVQPDVILIQADGWFIPYYIGQLRTKKKNGEYAYPQFAGIPVVAAVAVDGRNFKGEWIKDVSLAVFWTKFAFDEARAGGYFGPACVIPLGVDLETFYPVDRAEALERQKAGSLKDRFIVGNVNRNQPRKRWDLTLKYFSEWVHSRKVDDATLFLHSAPTGDESSDVMELAKYYNVLDRLAVVTPETFYGKHDDDMRDTYNCFDVCITTTQGEGFGLTTAEAMACGVPCIVPNWSALGDWAKGAAALVPCTSTALQSPGLSIIGGVVDQKAFLETLDALYRDKHHRESVGKLGLARVHEPQFRWQLIGEQWVDLLDNLLTPAEETTSDEIWQELGAAK